MAQKVIEQRDARRYARDFVRHLKRSYRLPIERAFVFGSFAKGAQRDWSDVDVCVISKKFGKVDPLEYLWTRRRDIDIERGIEPFGIHPNDFVDENPIASEVKKYGIVITD